MLNRKTYFIREHVGLMKLSDTYDILDPETKQQLGIAKEKIKTVSYYISPRYDYKDNITTLSGYDVVNTIQVTTGGPDTEEAVAPEIAAAGGAPGFIYRDEAHVDRVLLGPIGEEISAIARRKTGVEFVTYGEVGFRHLLSKRPVPRMEDLKGLKIRTPELRIWVDFWRKLGANPTPLPYAEQYSALSTGVIDGLEADFFSIRGFKWFEQAKNLTLTYHWFLPKAVRVNAKWLDGLPPDLQKLVRDSAREVFAEQRTTNRAKADAALAASIFHFGEHTVADVKRALEAKGVRVRWGS